MRTSWRIDWINWPVHSQQTARKNAQQALIELTHRRREREAVDRFLENRDNQRRQETMKPAHGRAAPAHLHRHR